MADLPEIKKYVQVVHVPAEVIEDMAGMPTITEIFDRLAEEERKFRALPAEEQARILAEREAERLAAKAERTCPRCGCDPDEHGGY